MTGIGRRGFITGAAATGVALAGTRIHAQDAWPTRNVHFIVPLAPGGAIDFIARQVGEVLTRSLGQQIVVENRTGAGGTLGMDLAMKSTPDGYTVLITNDNAASAPHIMNLAHDYTKELVPVCYLGRQSQILAVHSSINVKTVAELIDYVKANPGHRLCDVRRRQQPARDRRMVQARGRHQDGPCALSRCGTGDQRPDRRACEDRLPRTDGAEAAL